jgi:hypothetical protein
MEIDEETLQGQWTKDENNEPQFFIINDGLFSKLCILGDDEEPCFEGSQINVHFSLNEDATFAQTLYSMMNELRTVLELLKLQGWTVAITSWLSMDSTKEYDKLVRQAKREWLERYNFPFDEIHLVAYGTTKANCTRKNGGYQILIDDNAKIRNGWNLGGTINANENILEKLWALLLTE